MVLSFLYGYYPIIFPSSSHHISITYYIIKFSQHLLIFPAFVALPIPLGPSVLVQADIEALLEALGIPFVHAPAEAEAQCAFLAEARSVESWAMASWCRFFGTYDMENNIFFAG